MAYHVQKTKTVLRAAYNRFLETPSLENLLLSSSPETQIFSPGEEEREVLRGGGPSSSASRSSGGATQAGAPVQPSREWQVDTGFQQQFGRYIRLDADFYHRRMKNPSDATSFFETGIIFPATLASSRSMGVETRLDVARARGFSGFVSYTNLRIYGLHRWLAGCLERR